MLPSYDVVAVVPIGPGTNPEFARDTMESFYYYTAASNKVLILDDSGQGIGAVVKQMLPDVDVISTARPSGTMGGLYIALANAFSYALEHYNFKLILKLDTDALLIGRAPEFDMLTLVNNKPLTAIAGQYPLDYDGRPWDVGWPRARMINGTMTWKYIRRPIANIFLRKYYMRALNHGYRTGESVFGGSYFITYDFLRKLAEYRLLPDHRLRTLNLGEDHLFSLLAKTVGMELESLSGTGQPFACAWKGLPAAPEQLFEEGRKIIHSTRNWQGRGEAEIREFFQVRRALNGPLALSNKAETTGV